jgi:hypothetical protein
VDETDAFIDNEKTCRVNARVMAMSLPPGLRRLLLTSQQLQLQRQELHGANAPLTSFGSSPALSGTPGPAAVIVTSGTDRVAVVSTGSNQVAVVRTSQARGGAQARTSVSLSAPGNVGTAAAAGDGASGGGARHV